MVVNADAKRLIETFSRCVLILILIAASALVVYVFPYAVAMLVMLAATTAIWRLCVFSDMFATGYLVLICGLCLGGFLIIKMMSLSTYIGL